MSATALGRRIRQLRGTRTLEQIDEGAKIGVSKLSKLERGEEKNPTYKTLQSVARGLKRSLRELFETESRPEGAGHAQVGVVAGSALHPDLAAIIAIFQNTIDAGDDAPDTIEGDVLKAYAVLTRAVERLGRAQAHQRASGGDDT